jgi:hypothetical protein
MLLLSFQLAHSLDNGLFAGFLQLSSKYELVQNKVDLLKIENQIQLNTLLKKWSRISTNKWILSRYTSSLSVMSTHREKKRPAYRRYITLCVRNCRPDQVSITKIAEDRYLRSPIGIGTKRNQKSLSHIHKLATK